MFCFHKYGKVDKDRYQYCTKCGKASIVGCNHSYDLIRTINVCTISNTPSYQIMVSKCCKCGDIKQTKVGYDQSDIY